MKSIDLFNKIKSTLRTYDLYLTHTVTQTRLYHFEVENKYHSIVSYYEMVEWLEIMKSLDANLNKSYFSSSKIHLIFDNHEQFGANSKSNI